MTADEHGTGINHETSDAEARPLVAFAVFLAVATLVTALLTAGFYKYLEDRERAEQVHDYPMADGIARPVPPPPRLQTYPFTDLKSYRRQESELLDRYGWVDRNAGIVRIPIERAIELTAERGLPARDVSGGKAAAPEHGPPSSPTDAAPQPGAHAAPQKPAH
jgi:hypothetical protein